MATRGDALVDWRLAGTNWETLTLINHGGITEGHAYSVVVGSNYLLLAVRCRSSTNARKHELILDFYNPPLGTPTVNGLKPSVPRGHGDVALAEGASASGGTSEVKVTVERKNDDTYTDRDVKATKSYLVRITACD